MDWWYIKYFKAKNSDKANDRNSASNDIKCGYTIHKKMWKLSGVNQPFCFLQENMCGYVLFRALEVNYTSGMITKCQYKKDFIFLKSKKMSPILSLGNIRDQMKWCPWYFSKKYSTIQQIQGSGLYC